MDRLGIDEGPVEIEYDGTNHARTMVGMPGLGLKAGAARSAAISRWRGSPLTVRNMTARHELPCIKTGKRGVGYRVVDLIG